MGGGRWAGRMRMSQCVCHWASLLACLRPPFSRYPIGPRALSHQRGGHVVAASLRSNGVLPCCPIGPRAAVATQGAPITLIIRVIRVIADGRIRSG